MSLKKIISAALSLCLLLTAFAAMPSFKAQAMSAEVVVINAATEVRSSADPSAAQKAGAAQNNSFLLLDTTTGSDGNEWYKIYYSSSVSGWVSSEDAVSLTASSATNDPYTLYLKRVAQVTADSFELRDKAGTSGKVIATVKKGERMVVLGYGNDGAGTTWFEVRYGAVNGWISRKAVTVTNICSLPTLDTSKKTPVIYLSPSRQPANLFAAGNTNEWEQMTRVANALRDILNQRYDCVVHMADYETPISKFDRPYEAYRLGADIYLAIHSNATGTSAKVNGTQSYYFPGSSQSKQMAENLVKRISAVAPFPDQTDGAINGMTYLNGVGYGEVRDPGGFGMISSLLEVEYHDRAESAQWIIDNPQLIAAAIADGLNDTFHFRAKGSSPITTTTTTTTTTTAITTTTSTTAGSVQDGHSPLGPTAQPTTSTTSTTTTTTTSTTTTSTIPTSTTASTTTTEPTTTTTTTTAPADSPEVVRAGGVNRIDTAAKISAMGWERADTVIIASGSSYPDALAGVPLSHAADAPILLTMSKSGAEAELLREIARLGAKKAYILGGEAAVSSAAEKALSDAGLTCTRLAGSDRYETSVIIARELSKLTGHSFDTLYFASAVNFPDALAISPVAAIEGNPVLYISADDGLNRTMADYARSTGCKKAVLLGGEAALSAEGKASIEQLGISVERISGSDRYATGLAVVKRFRSVFEGSGAAVATGKNFPDALAGGAHAAKLGIPVLLVGNDTTTDLLTFVYSLESGDVYVYGGVNAVSDIIAQTILNVIR